MYIFWFLHQTTTEHLRWLEIPRLYIFWFLHQTTTLWLLMQWWSCCISFDSYIKPQPWSVDPHILQVVYLLIPTSNHNLKVIIIFLCSLYIFWFLHQTTTFCKITFMINCCISFDSYIKPQLHVFRNSYQQVVYLLIPTSNHNYANTLSLTPSLYIFWFLHQTTTYSCFLCYGFCCISFDSYIKPQPMLRLYVKLKVVYLLIPTSNHNVT